MKRTIEIDAIQIRDHLVEKGDCANTRIVFSVKLDGIIHELRFDVSGFDHLNAESFDYRIDSVITMLLLHMILGGGI